MNRLQTQRGFTLVELVIYLVVASIVIVLGFHLWSNAAFSSADTRIRHEMSQEMQEMLFFLEDDLARVGAKTRQEKMSVNGANGVDEWNRTMFRQDIFLDTSAASPDFSSFELIDSDSLDTFRFKTLVYDSTGVAVAIDSIAYSVNNQKKLIRRMSRWAIDSTGTRTVVTSDSAVVVAEHVDVFDISAGVHAGGAAGDTLFHMTNPEWEAGTDSSPNATLSNNSTTRSLSVTIGDEDVGKYDLYVFRDSSTSALFAHDSLSKRETYRLDLQMAASKSMSLSFNAPVAGSTLPADTIALFLMRGAPTLQLVPGVDTLYLFPVRDQTENLSFEIAPSASVPASNLQFRMRVVTSSENLDTEGVVPRSFTLSKITLHRTSGGGYQQVANPTVQQKERTKSLDVRMTVRRGDARQKHGEAYLTQSFRKIVKIPNNGPVR